MLKKTTLFAALFLTACITISQRTVPTATPVFVTATLPPTRAVTPSASPTARGTSTPTLAVTAPADCKDSAVLLADVTIPDNTVVARGASFTKTWQFKNTGACPWTNYTIQFEAGDRMGAPDSAPVTQTASGATVDVSVDLVAPTTDGTYTGFFSLHNAAGRTLSIGVEETFWVKIVVGASSQVTASAANTPTNGGNCQSGTNGAYVNQMAALVNSARAEAGLPALTVNAQLAAAAQGHAVDMACHSMISHTGSDGSTVHSRIVAAGYSPSYSEEIIYAGGGPEAAFQWWMNDAPHRAAILNPNVTEMGIGYASAASSLYGDYFTVDFASP
ncbi:MAG: CAP domain-containing protein [Chloroflexota bacterium]